MGEEDFSRELQLLPRPLTSTLPKWASSTASPRKQNSSTDPSLELKLSVGMSQFEPPPSSEVTKKNAKGIQALQWHAAEQIRLAAVEKAYAEQVKDLTRREMEIAEEEFARARLAWEIAREEVKKAERMKEMATKNISSTCVEITCRACKQRFTA